MRSGTRRLTSVLAVTLSVLVAGMMLGVGPAAATVMRVQGHRYGVSPATRSARTNAAAACTTDCTAMIYHDGPVMHAEKVSLLFWTPAGHAVPSTYRSGLATSLSQVAGNDYTPGNPFALNQQYYDLSGKGGTKRFVPYAITAGPALTDTDPYPANGCSDTTGSGTPIPVCVTDAQIQSELSAYAAAHSLATGPGVLYLVLTPVNVGSCFGSSGAACSYTGYCGYHSYMGTPGSGTEVLYAHIPWQYGVNGCDIDQAFGAGYPNGDAIDPAVSMVSHEASEAMTDPNLNGWFDGSGNENGDKCAYNYNGDSYGSMAGLANNGLGYYNITFGTDDYLLQTEFDQRTLACALTDTDTQPVVTVSPHTATHGVLTKFTVKVTDPAGVSTVSWNFGDGTKTAVTTTTSIKHTYATAGSKMLTVIVTDNHGNEKQVTRAITVS